MEDIVQQNKQQKIETQPNSTRMLGITLMVIQLGIIFAYGFEGGFYQEQPSAPILTDLFYLLMMVLLVLLGFGLLISSYLHATWLGITTSLITLSIAVLLNPLFNKFWFNAFVSGFEDTDSLPTTSPIYQFWQRHHGPVLEISVSGLHDALLSSIGILIIHTACIGRNSLGQLLRMLLIFEFFFSMNYYLNIYININRGNPLVFDGYGGTFLYLFSAAFGTVYTFAITKQKVTPNISKNEMNRASMLLSLIGGGFIMATLPFASTHYIGYDGKGESIAAFNVWFCMVGSIVGTYAMSVLLGNGKVGFRDVMVGGMGGPILVAAVAPILSNIGIAFMIGLMGGAVTGAYMGIIHPYINRNYIYDTMGLFGPFLTNAVLGSFVITPAVLSAHYTQSITINVGGSVITDAGTAGFHLAYMGVSVAIGLIGGVVAGAMSFCETDVYGILGNQRFYLHDKGLYMKARLQDIPEEKVQSAQEIKAPY